VHRRASRQIRSPDRRRRTSASPNAKRACLLAIRVDLVFERRPSIIETRLERVGVDAVDRARVLEEVLGCSPAGVLLALFLEDRRVPVPVRRWVGVANLVPHALAGDRGRHRVRTEVRQRDEYDSKLARFDVLSNEVGERLPFELFAERTLEVRPVVELERCIGRTHNRLSPQFDAELGRLVARVKRRGEVVSGVVGSREIVSAADAESSNETCNESATRRLIERHRLFALTFTLPALNGSADLLGQQNRIEVSSVPLRFAHSPLATVRR